MRTAVIITAITSALLLVGCGAGTRVSFSEVKESLDANGAVTGRETVTVERSSRAINTKVALSDLESNVSYNPTNGMASGLSTADLKADPETRMFEAFEKGMSTAAAFRGVSQSDGQMSEFQQQFFLELLRQQFRPDPGATNNPPALSDEDLSDVRALLEGLRAERARREEE